MNDTVRNFGFEIHALIVVVSRIEVGAMSKQEFALSVFIARDA